MQFTHVQMFWILSMGVSKCLVKQFQLVWRYKKNADWISTNWNAQGLERANYFNLLISEKLDIDLDVAFRVNQLKKKVPSHIKFSLSSKE